MHASTLSLESTTAIEAAKIGAQKALTYFDKNIVVEMKDDDTPVTVADRESEKAIKSYIFSKIPNANFVGEESGGDINVEEFWIADPVDGTRSFARGIPTWCVIVSFCKNNDVITTAVYYPHEDVCYHAEKGKGAFKNGERVHVSDIANLSKSYLGYGSPKHFEDKQVIVDLIEACGSARSWEATYSACLVVEGKMDVTVDSYGRIWDLAPFKLLVEEAGGRITRLDGSEWDFQGYGAVLSNGLLHDEVLHIVNGRK